MTNRHSLWIAHRLNIVLQTAYTWLDEDIYIVIIIIMCLMSHLVYIALVLFPHLIRFWVGEIQGGDH